MTNDYMRERIRLSPRRSRDWRSSSAYGNYRLARVELRGFSRAMVSGEQPPATDPRAFTMAMLRRGHLRLGAFV